MHLELQLRNADKSRVNASETTETQTRTHITTYLDVAELHDGVNAVSDVLQADIARARLPVGQFVEGDDRVHLPDVFRLHDEANAHVREKLVAHRVQHLVLL